MIAAALVATLASGGGAAANWGSEPAAADESTEIATETTLTPIMELPNGCADDWSFEGSID
jgi:hypothetical protein